MLTFFKKDVLIYWRDRKEIIISLITPIVIITILGFALPGWVENSSKSLKMDVALVHLDEEQAAAQQFQETIMTKSLPVQTMQSIRMQAEQLSPIQMIVQLFQDEQVKQIVNIRELHYEEALQQLQDEQVAAIVEIPEGFTLAALNKLLLNEGEWADLRVIAEGNSQHAVFLTTLIDGYLHSLNFRNTVHHQLGPEAARAMNAIDEVGTIGGRELLSGISTNMVTAHQYFALAVSIFFGLFVSITTSSKAITEKREHVFHRILLTGSHPLKYLAGKLCSTLCLTWLLMAVVLLVSHFILNIFPDRSLSFWLGMSFVLAVLSVSVGALAALFTALVFRLSESAASTIPFFAVLIACTIGGSLVPVYVLPDFLQSAGEWTPNGLALAVLLKWLQTETTADLTIPLIKLAIFAAAAAATAFLSFPRRGRIG